ncbi:MAG TPA: zinc ribbon domain-containing protein [Candidatus Mcinerneyibacteriales bacterium]|nr:zinc ribbon domain-containing protein [Candidatus Mcinerneyibacteriales bacterium]HPJ70976.1 zinc ribbon domain-containing protein [Candidatus Mcinerneyibacteriales bacterium]HPQ89879.1 zinc ribbon domain-containing protein [Candidatus Mcinerneyibacteriales bacterium]
MATYICPQCGADIELENGLTCEYCGYEVPGKTCSQCGREIPEEESVCPFCGHVEGTASSPEGEPALADLGAHHFGEVISNVPQSSEIRGSAFEETEDHFGHEEEIEEIIEEHEEEILEAELPEEETTPIEEPSSYENEEAGGSEEKSTPFSMGHEEEVQYITYSEVEEPVPSAQSRAVPQASEEKICKACGFGNPTIAKFCLSCGSSLEEEEGGKEEENALVCPECGFENVTDARFCMVCGAKLTPPSAAEIPDTAEQRADEEEVPSEAPSGTSPLYKVKITYDKENKFQHKFVFNKILESNSSISENELNMLMSNNTFSILVEAEKFNSLQTELEDLDCTVEKIGEEIPGSESFAYEEEEPFNEGKTGAQSYSLVVKGMEGHDQAWREKFVKMMLLMMPDMTEEKAWEIASSESKRIPVESEESARDLQKILSRLGCITQIIEHKGHQGEGELPQEKKEAPKEAPPPVEKTHARPVDDGLSVEEPKYLILSGVDKRNWVVREKLAESIVDIYPNMTPDIAAGIVSQPVVKLRVQNQEDAQRLGKQFEEMGWNIRIEDVSTFSDTTRRTGTTVSRADVQRRKAARMSYLKREKGKRRNLITTIIITIIVAAALLIVYDNFFKPRYYVTVQADAAHPEVAFTASLGSFVYLRTEPSLGSRRDDYKVPLETVLRLYRKETVTGEDGMEYYEVFVPGFRAHRGYLLAELARRTDENGNPIALP